MSDTLAFPIPTPDILPLTAPLWLLKGLLLLTLLLHLVAMNWLVGGSLMAWYSRRRALRGDADHHTLLGDITGMLPTIVAATVTLGVAPLLFVQLLYGHLVYTSSIALGWFWWSVVPLLIVAYYLLYRWKFAGGKRSGKLTAWLAPLILVWISFVISNNFNLASQPERFAAMLQTDSHGWWLNLRDPATFPRWLHMVLGAVAIAGVGLIWFGWTRRGSNGNYARFCMDRGYRWFAYPTMVNILVGFTFMMALPREVMLAMMGRDLAMTALWMAGLTAAIAALAVFKRGIESSSPAPLLLGTALTGIAMAAMVLLRDMVRSAYLHGIFRLSDQPIATEWGPIVTFTVFFVVGLAGFWWLVAAYYRSGGVEREPGAG